MDEIILNNRLQDEFNDRNIGKFRPALHTGVEFSLITVFKQFQVFLTVMHLLHESYHICFL